MESFRIRKLLVIIVLIVISVNCVDGYSLNTRWYIEKQSNGPEASRLCSDILQVTRKLLENNLIRDVIYPKLSDDGMFSKSTKVVETRSPPRRNVVHFPSNKQYYNENFNRTENSRFKRHHGLDSQSTNNNNQYNQQNLFNLVQPMSSSTINLVPFNVPYEETEHLNRQPQAYIVDLSSLNEPQSVSINQVDQQIDLSRNAGPRFYNDGQLMEQENLQRRQDEEDSDNGGGNESEVEGGQSKEPNVVKKTFGYKVTLYKSPNIKEPHVLTEEFFGDGKKKKVIKILKKDEKQTGNEGHLSQQSSSSSGRYVPQYVTAPVGTMDQSDEDELEANRKLLGHVRKQLANEKGIEATRTISKSGDEKQHDKKGAKEKALREKTQIEFFEREKIFDDRYGRKLEESQPKNEFPAMQGRPEIIRLTTTTPEPSRERDQITVVSPDDISNAENTGGMDFQSLHDLLLKRLKGWREKGYKITTELEIVQRGAVHDKERSVRQRGKGQQTFQRYESGGAIREKTPVSYNNDQGFGQIEPLTVTHVSPDNDKSQYRVKDSGKGNKNAVEEEENQGNLFSSLPKFLIDPPDYEAALDGNNGQKMDPILEMQQDPRQHLQLTQPVQPHQIVHPPPHQIVHSPPHHTLILTHHPPPPPEALKLVQPNSQANPPKTSRLVSTNNGTNTEKPKRKGRKYSFKGMTRKIPSTTINENAKRDEGVQLNVEKVTSLSPPTSYQSNKFETQGGTTTNKVRGKTKKPKDGQSSRRLAAQQRLKAKAKQKAKLQQQLQQQQYQQQVKQLQKLQQQQNQQIKHQQQKQNQLQHVKPTSQPLGQSKQPNPSIFRSPMSIQDQIMYPASPLIGNSVHGEGIPPRGIDLSNPLSFLDGVHEGLFMPNENGFEDISFGNPTLITLPGLLDSPNSEHENPLNEHFRTLMNHGGGNNGGINSNNDINGVKQNQNFNFQDDHGKKQPHINTISYDDPMNQLRAPPHTEILIGKPSPGAKQLSPTKTLTSTGQYKNNNKIRDYPTSIQDITRGKKLSNNYDIEPGFGRESPDNLIIPPGKGADPMFNHFKNDIFTNEKLPNDWTDQQGLTNNNNNHKDLQVNWHPNNDGRTVELLKNNPRNAILWDPKANNQQIKPPNLSNYNNRLINHQNNQLINLGNNRGATRYSTEKPINNQKLGYILDEPLELIPGDRIKPGDYRQSFWTEPEMERVNKRRQNRKNKIKVNNNINNNGQNGHFQSHQVTEDIFSVGFDSQRVRSPKSNDLISRSSQIYPLIGGYSPFIIPSSSIEPENDSDLKTHHDDDEDENVSLDGSDDNDSGLNHGDDNNNNDNHQPEDPNINGDDRRRKLTNDDDFDDDDDDKKDDDNQQVTKMMSINDDDAKDNDYPTNITTISDPKQESINNNQKEKVINKISGILINDKINGEKNNQLINSNNQTDSSSKEVTEKSLIWSQPCPTCPEI